MGSCDYSTVAFGKYFNENMEALGLPTPTGMYESALTIFGIAGTLGETAHLYPNMPASTALKGSYQFERAKIGTAAGISFYVGAMIGSAAVATGRVAGCGATIADAIWLARENGIYGTWLEHELVAHPEFINPLR